MNNYIECKCIAFSAVYFQMSPWIVCPWGWILTLIAFVWGFSSVCFKWFLLRPVVPSVAWVPIFLHYVISEESSKYHPVGWIVPLAAFVDFTQLWIIKWVLKTCAFEAYFWPNKTSNEILMPGGGVKGRLFDFSHMWAWAQGFLQSLKIWWKWRWPKGLVMVLSQGLQLGLAMRLFLLMRITNKKK